MDKIHLVGIRAYGYIGALPEENILGQWFEVDLVLGLDLTRASQSDDLADTHDYRPVIEATQRIIKECNFRLIERLAGAIAVAALQADTRLQEITVRVTKLSPPIPDFTGQVAVEISRDRSVLASI